MHPSQPNPALFNPLCKYNKSKRKIILVLKMTINVKKKTHPQNSTWIEQSYGEIPKGG